MNFVKLTNFFNNFLFTFQVSLTFKSIDKNVKKIGSILSRDKQHCGRGNINVSRNFN